MKLILHHLAKDVRAQRWLLLLWALFILAYLGSDLLVIQPSYEIAHAGEFLLDSPLLSVGSSVVWMLLLVGLIQSEPVVGSSSFWLTRPVPRWVVILSKLTFLAVFLIVPWLAITAWELLLLQVAPALFWQAFLPAGWTLGLTIVLLWIATFTRTLGGFLATTGLILTAVIGVFGARMLYRLSFIHGQLEPTQISLAIFILLSGLIVSALVQQLRRKTPAGIWIAAGSTALALLAGFFWPIAMPARFTLLDFVPGATAAFVQKMAHVDFAPGWPASVMWSQPNQPNGASSTVVVTNSVVVGVNSAKPVSTTDDEGNPVIIGALVASAPLIPVSSSTTEFPLIEGVEASFKLSDGPAHELPRRDSDVFNDKSTQFDLVQAAQNNLPGTTITTATNRRSTLAPTPLFKLDAENLDLLRGKTGDLTLRLYGHLQTLTRVAAIPLDGDAFSRIPSGVIHAHFTTRQTQSIFGIDIPIVTNDKPMLAVRQVVYQPAVLLFQTENYYILVDTATHSGVILSNASTFPHHAAGSFSLRSSWTDYLTLPFDASFEGALDHKVLYIYSSTPEAFFSATLTAPGFTMSPP